VYRLSDRLQNGVKTVLLKTPREHPENGKFGRKARAMPAPDVLIRVGDEAILALILGLHRVGADFACAKVDSDREVVIAGLACGLPGAADANGTIARRFGGDFEVWVLFCFLVWVFLDCDVDIECQGGDPAGESVVVCAGDCTFECHVSFPFAK
jgi:hypothetical protein